MTEFLLLLALAAWVGTDMTAALQLMVSQPLVAGWLAGAVVGEPGAGLAAGIVLQFVWGRALPLGGASFPAAGPAAVTAGAVAAWGARDAAHRVGGIAIPDASTLALALVLGLAVGELGRPLIQAIRRRRGNLVRTALAAADRGDARGVVAANLAGVLQSAGLGLALGVVGLGVGRSLPAILGDLPRAGGEWVLYAALGAGIGHAASTLASRRPERLGLVVVGAAVLAWGMLR